MQMVPHSSHVAILSEQQDEPLQQRLLKVLLPPSPSASTKTPITTFNSNLVISVHDGNPYLGYGPWWRSHLPH